MRKIDFKYAASVLARRFAVAVDDYLQVRIMCIRRRRYLTGVAICILMTIPVLFFSACSATELEDRGLPLAIAIDKKDEGILLSFDFPELGKKSDQKSEQKGSEKKKPISVEAGAYFEAQKTYENNSNRSLDYNHLKAIILSQDFLADERAVRDLLAWLAKEEALARNTCLFLAKDKAAEILTLTEGFAGSVGDYLEQMTQNQTDFRNRKIATIGSLMNQWHNQNELLLLPVLTDNGGHPSITEYAAVDSFVYKGNISVEDAMNAFLAQGLVKELTCHLDNGAVVEIKNIRDHIRIAAYEDSPETEATEGKGRAEILINGRARIKKEGEGGKLTAGQTKQSLNQQLAESLSETASRLQKDLGIDMTNSYYKLGRKNLGLHGKYEKSYVEYGKGLSYLFQVDISLVND